MRHVALRGAQRIHLLEEGKRETLCRQSILTGESFEGMPVYKATDTPKAADCIKCHVVLRDSLFRTLSNEPTSVLEVLVEEFHAKMAPTRGQRNYRK